MDTQQSTVPYATDSAQALSSHAFKEIDRFSDENRFPKEVAWEVAQGLKASVTKRTEGWRKHFPPGSQLTLIQNTAYNKYANCSSLGEGKPIRHALTWLIRIDPADPEATEASFDFTAEVQAFTVDPAGEKGGLPDWEAPRVRRPGRSRKVTEALAGGAASAAGVSGTDGDSTSAKARDADRDIDGSFNEELRGPLDDALSDHIWATGNWLEEETSPEPETQEQIEQHLWAKCRSELVKTFFSETDPALERITWTPSDWTHQVDPVNERSLYSNISTGTAFVGETSLGSFVLKWVVSHGSDGFRLETGVIEPLERAS
jgi:hypothetical protein